MAVLLMLVRRSWGYIKCQKKETASTWRKRCFANIKVTRVGKMIRHSPWIHTRTWEKFTMCIRSCKRVLYNFEYWHKGMDICGTLPLTIINYYTCIPLLLNSANKSDQLSIHIHTSSTRDATIHWPIAIP